MYVLFSPLGAILENLGWVVKGLKLQLRQMLEGSITSQP